MKKVLNASLFAALTLAVPVYAADLSPGMWEITMESRVPNDPGWTPTPFNLRQCLTAGDAADPSRLIGGIATPGATGCDYTEKAYSGSTFRFALVCAGTLGMKATGSVDFRADNFSGNIAATASVGGQSVEMQNRVTGKRAGGC